MSPDASAGPSVARLAAPGIDYVRFIVLGDARTGSYMLVQALDSHPNITCFSELFQWEVDFVDFNVAGYDNYSAEDKTLRDQNFQGFLRERIFCSRPDETQAVGFKLLYAHVWGIKDLLDRLIEDTDIRIVHLRRQNLLRMLVSTKLAQATGVWRLDRGFAPSRFLEPATWWKAARHPFHAAAALRRWLRPAPPPTEMAPKRVRLSFDECNFFFVKAQHEVDHFAGLFAKHPSIAVDYEDMIRDKSSTFAQIQSFLGVPQERLTVTLARQNPEPLSALIDNYEELREAFRGTPAGPFFE